MNDIVNDKKGSQYCERQTALLISQAAYLLYVLYLFLRIVKFLKSTILICGMPTENLMQKKI